MLLETTVILRTALYQLEMADSLEEAKEAIRVMCTEDDIAVVKERVEATKKLKGEKE